MSHAAPARQEVDLTRSHSVANLLALSLELFWRHLGLFFTMSLVVVAPFVILVDGVWGEALHDGPNAEPGSAAAAASWIAYTFVVPPLISAFHAVAVRDLGAGRVPGIAQAMRAAAPRLPAAFGVVALVTLGIALGFLALIVPGIWLAIRWAFAPQAAVLHEAPAFKATSRSAELVRGQWWNVLGAFAAGVILFSFGVAGFGLLAAGLVGDNVIYVSLLAIVQTVALSLFALFWSLLYFTMQARSAEPGE